MSRTLVTGVAGFIGSHVAERLLADGHHVIGIDSFREHYPRTVKEQNIATLITEPRFELVERDIVDEAVTELFAAVDIAYHLAARPGVRDSWEHFSEYVAANVFGSRSVFAAAAATKTRVVYASSSSVYGDAIALPASETAPLAPVSPYGASKVTTEALASAYSSSYGLDAVGLRYFSVYGPRQRPDMAIAQFIEAVVAQRPLRIFGDGLQRRDMTYIDDVVDGTIAAAAHGRPRGIYNIASGSPLALITILEELADVLASPLELSHEDIKTGDVRDTWGDITQAATDLDYHPSTSLRAGLEHQAAEAANRRAQSAIREPKGVMM